MINNNICITSSSNILINKHNLTLLKKYGKISFSEFGNIENAISNNKNSALIVTIFFQDYDIENINNLKKRINFLISLIEKRLNENNNLVIFSFSTWRETNLIKSLRYENKFESLKNNLKKKIHLITKKFSNLYCIDLDNEFARVGLNECIDPRNYNLFRSWLSKKGNNIYYTALERVFRSIYNQPKKLLVLDCDNTLWGGIIGEDGIENIQIGSDGLGFAFTKFQKKILELKKKGILLGVASKNDEKSVFEVFQKHKEMKLKKKDFLSFKINWNEKYLNIKKMSEDLNIGTSSIIFWDDNPLEREKMRKLLPEVETVDVPKDVSEWANLIEKLDYFHKPNLTQEDRKKTYQYKIRAKFVDKASDAKNINSYLKSLSLKTKVYDLDNSTIQRASQMLFKTNQFNITLNRFSVSELKTKKRGKYISKLISLKDNFGDHGIICFFTLKFFEKKIVTIDNFVMSCRVFGRFLEDWVFNLIKEILNKKKISNLIIFHNVNEKNKPVRDFFTRLNIKEEKKADSKIYLNKINIGLKKNIKVYNIDLNKISFKNAGLYNVKK